MLRFACPKCHATLKVPDGKGGARIQCPRCRTALLVPSSAPPSDPGPGQPLPASVGSYHDPAPNRRQAAAPEDDLEVVESPSPARKMPSAPPPADDYDREETQRPRRGPDVIIVQQGGGTDAPGVISLIFGCLSVVCTIFGCCVPITYLAAVPFALLGGVVGFFGRGNMRVAGLVLNFLALVPAVIGLVVLVCFVGLLGVGAAIAPGQPGRQQAPPPAVGQAAAPESQPDQGQMTLKEFILQRPAGPVAIRVECELDTYYNYDYRGAEDTHYSVRLRNATGPYALAHGYVAKSSAEGKRLYELLKDGRPRAEVLRLQHAGPDGGPSRTPDHFAIVAPDEAGAADKGKPGAGPERETPAPVARVRLTELYNAYGVPGANRAQADAAYTDKVVEVSEYAFPLYDYTIQGGRGRYYLDIPYTSLGWVRFQFREGEDLAGFNPHDSQRYHLTQTHGPLMTFRGTCRGIHGNVVLVTDTTVVSVRDVEDTPEPWQQEAARDKERQWQEHQKAQDQQQKEQEEARKAEEEEKARQLKEAQEKKAAEQEGAADRRLAYAQKKLDDDKPLEAAGYLKELIERYPNTKAAEKARQLLKKIGQ